MRPVCLRKFLSAALSAVLTMTAIPGMLIQAEETSASYPYIMFAASGAEGAITVNAEHFCANGDIATNGTMIASGISSMNGEIKEAVNEPMIFIFDKIDERYFTASNSNEHEEDYILSETNISIDTPTAVRGETTLTGNINISTALKSLEDLNLYGEVKNTNDAVLFSKYGDISIESENVNLNGLIYAPFGKVTIKAGSLNLNQVVIIADSISLTCPDVNANYSEQAGSFAGTDSELLDIPREEWRHMEDENGNDFPDFFEDYDNWVLLKDTDGDYLPDCVEQFLGTDVNLADTDGDMLDDYYEVFETGTNPTLSDTDNNGVADGDEDFDTDGLTNYGEYIRGTSPWDKDSDSDNLSDGDETNIYGTDPLKPDTDFDGLGDGDEIYLGTNPNLSDTDGNGIPDRDERFEQSFTYTAENEDCVIEQVIVSMSGTGNLQTNTTVENIMDRDVICSGVVGLVGVPFSIESTSDFDTATISFRIDKSRLGGTDFRDLLFLWYDEENDNFVELETSFDEANSLVSVQTTHFSKYLVVDRNQWYEAWSNELNYRGDSHEISACHVVLAVDCSGSMQTHDPITVIPPSSAPYRSVNSCERQKAVSGFTSALDHDDKAAIVTFDNTARVACELTDDISALYWASAAFYNDGGTDFNAALQKSMDVLKGSSGATRKKIILLSDGESNVSDSILEEAKDLYIKIYTVSLGSSAQDSVLKEIASETGGEFYKAYTADALVDIYSDIGTEGDFDRTDTDGDGLYDAVEAAGIRIQNGTVISGCNPVDADTDNDALNDGEEIEPIPRKSNKLIRNEDGTVNTVKGYYFVLKSDPTRKDSDGDLDSDTIDPNPAQYQLNGRFIEKLHRLEQYAQEYNDNFTDWVVKYSISRKHWLSLMFIRSFANDLDGQSNYIDKTWSAVGGDIDWGFVDYINIRDPKLFEYFHNITDIYANPAGEIVDLRHFAAAATAYIYKTGLLDSKFLEDEHPSEWDKIGDKKKLGANALSVAKSEMFEYHLDNLGGWAGDLQTLMNELHDKVGDNKGYDAFYKALYDSIGTGSFSMDDFYADTDSYNIYMMLRDGTAESLSEAFDDYYTDGYLKRYSSFTNNWDEETISDLTYTYTKTYFAHLIRWPLFLYDFSDSQSEAARDAFVRFLMEKISHE